MYTPIVEQHCHIDLNVDEGVAILDKHEPELVALIELQKAAGQTPGAYRFDDGYCVVMYDRTLAEDLEIAPEILAKYWAFVMPADFRLVDKLCALGVGWRLFELN